MKKSAIFICLLVFSAVSTAQKEVKFHLISLQDKANAAYIFDFYVDKVYDGRQFKENIGTVQKGAFNKKTVANFEKPLVQELQDYFAVAYPKNAGRKIDIRIHDVFVSEMTESTKETGFASIIFDVIEEKDNVPYVVGTYSDLVQGNAMDVTSKHAERIKEVIQRCMNQYNNTAAENKSARIFNPNEPVNKVIAGLPKKGVYVSYADALNNNPVFEHQFFQTNKNEKYLIFNETTRAPLKNYFGFSDGQDFYINISKYSKDKFYSKAAIIGNKYYLENVQHDQMDAVAFGVIFGVMGYMMAASQNESVPMLIDCYTGQPTFLSNAEMKAFLATSPELLKEFKQSKKTDEDKKIILRKYYAEN